MRPNWLTIGLLISAISLGFAQQPPTSWSAIDQARGKGIIVILRNDNNSLTGQLEEVSTDSLTSCNASAELSSRTATPGRFMREDAEKRRYLGLAIGTGSGALRGAVGTQPCDACIISFSRGQGAAVGAVAGAAVGSIVSVLVGGKHKQVLLYDSGAAVAAHWPVNCFHYSYDHLGPGIQM